MHETAFSKLKRKTAEIVFPSRCPFCKAVISGDKLFCDTCTKALPQIAYSRFAAGGIPCSAALPYFEEYAGAMKRYKFGKKSDYARAFAFLTVRAARLKFGDQHFDAVACVPMSERAKRKRHFEHAEILAKKCAELLDLPYIEALEKHKENKPQHTLRRSERERNVKGVYRIKDKSLCRGKSILLIDDIITTGNTLGECVRVLKRGGCKCVCCAVTCTTIV